MNYTSSIDLSSNPLWIGKIKDLKYRICVSYFLGIINNSQFRFDRKTPYLNIVESSGCWIWNRTLQRTGYGIYTMNGRRKSSYPHRSFYEFFNGPLVNGLTIDHLCRNRACCNPEHLEQVTKKENTLRGMSPPAVNARRTHCVNGHEFSKENTHETPNNPRVKRYCKQCLRDRHKKYKLN